MGESPDSRIGLGVASLGRRSSVTLSLSLLFGSCWAEHIQVLAARQIEIMFNVWKDLRRSEIGMA